MTGAKLFCDLLIYSSLPRDDPVARKYLADKVIIRDFLLFQVNHLNLELPGVYFDYLIGQSTRAVI